LRPQCDEPVIAIMSAMVKGDVDRHGSLGCASGGWAGWRRHNA